MGRVLLNKKYIAELAMKWTIGFFAFLGLIGTFTSLDELMDENISIKCRIAISIGILLAVYVLSFIGCALIVCKKRRYEILDLNDGYHLYVQYGDVFSEAEVLNPQKRRNIVIPVNRCFDTRVDDDLISSNTLHGIAMEKIYATGHFDADTLNSEIQKTLEAQRIPFDDVLISDKRSGNLRRYPAGTVAEIKISSNCTYFFLGLSSFDRNLKATTSDEDYVLALIRLLEFCNARSQQFPIVMPLIGAGLSRTQKNERDILEYIVKLIKMYEKSIHFNIHIIVRENGKNCISITNL